MQNIVASRRRRGVKGNLKGRKEEIVRLLTRSIACSRLKCYGGSVAAVVAAAVVL